MSYVNFVCEERRDSEKKEDRSEEYKKMKKRNVHKNTKSPKCQYLCDNSYVAFIIFEAL